MLGEHLNLEKKDLEVDESGHVDEGEAKAADIMAKFLSTYKSNGQAPLILKHESYHVASVECIIKLLLRVRKMYGAVQEVIKLLSQIQKQREVFEPNGSLVALINSDCLFGMSPEEEQHLISGLTVLQTLSRKIALFMQEHKLFKSFHFAG